MKNIISPVEISCRRERVVLENMNCVYSISLGIHRHIQYIDGDSSASHLKVLKRKIALHLVLTIRLIMWNNFFTPIIEGKENQ
jgi:hypothetical protein